MPLVCHGTQFCPDAARTMPPGFVAYQVVDSVEIDVTSKA
jgi:hypothetical protein